MEVNFLIWRLTNTSFEQHNEANFLETRFLRE